MIEDGETYDTLRGASFDGRGVIVEDPDVLWQIGVNVWERYTGRFTEDAKPMVEAMLRKRIAVRLEVDRVRVVGPPQARTSRHGGGWHDRARGIAPRGESGVPARGTGASPLSPLGKGPWR